MGGFQRPLFPGPPMAVGFIWNHSVAMGYARLWEVESSSILVIQQNTTLCLPLPRPIQNYHSM